jgi:hypothetical protein
MLIELSPGGRKTGEVVVIECRVDDFVTVPGEVSRFDGHWRRQTD